MLARPVLALVLAALLAACGPPRSVAQNAAALAAAAPEAGLAEIDSTTLYRHLAELASDAYEGRGTGTRGEEMAVEYIADQMRALGLEGGAADGSFFQRVPLRGATATSVSPLVLTPDDTEPVRLEFVTDFIASSDLDAPEAAIRDAELVFVGYGIENPGYDWDDYKGVDVRGKVIVAFVNDPPATAEEPDLFQADTLTYNGRWTYKYEEARRRGALGALLIHTPETAGYPFQVLSAGARGEQISLSEPPEGALTVAGWLTQPAAERLAQLSGTTLDTWFEEAARRDFHPRTLPVTATLSMELESRRFEGTNVIGKLTGAERPEEAVVYTAHHDHLGMNEALIAAGEDGIYNGAVDNASGVSMLLTLAEAFTAAEPPARTVLFMTLTAEESGLLGSAHYAQHPVIPLARTIANVNVDSGNLSGPTEDIVGIGAERSEMLGLLREAAAAEGMTVTPDNQPNQGLFFRSDQLAFARGGVPAVFVKTGHHFVGRPEGYAEEVSNDYRMNRYHQPGDELTGDELLGGLVQQTRVAFRLGWMLADSDLRPQWKPSEAFAQTRAESEAAMGD
ncbi:MAG TPA: M28 family peptidase [Rubricoccaceae bacterium]|nr:M28 family peptidase [Rubricoccaceae bacterium]